MKAMSAQSAREPGVDRTRGGVLFELASANGRPSEQGGFADTLKSIAVRFKRQADSPPEPEDVKKSSHPDEPIVAAMGAQEQSNNVPQYERGPRVQTTLAAGDGADKTDPLSAGAVLLAFGSSSAGTDKTEPSARGAALLASGSSSGDTADTAEMESSAPQKIAPTLTPGSLLLIDTPESELLEGELVGKTSPGSPMSDSQKSGKLAAGDLPVNALMREIEQATGVPKIIPLPADATRSEQDTGDVKLGRLQEIFAKVIGETREQSGSVITAALPDRGMVAPAKESLSVAQPREWGSIQDILNSLNAASAKPILEGATLQVSPQQSVQPAVIRGAQADYERLFDQIVQSVRLAQNHERSEIYVHLKPEFLGRMSIRVLASESRMHIEFKVENESVRQVMQDNMADLQRKLADKGISFDRFSVLADMGWAARREPDWEFAAPAIGFGRERETVAVAATPDSVPLTVSGMIDYFA